MTLAADIERGSLIAQDCIDSYQRTLSYVLETILGVPLADVDTHPFPSDRERLRAWSIESLHMALGNVAKGDYVVALRCLLQAASYHGRAGNQWPHPTCHDVYICVMNDIAAKLRGQ
jgi:hypothetical protein